MTPKYLSHLATKTQRHKGDVSLRVLVSWWPSGGLWGENGDGHPQDDEAVSRGGIQGAGDQRERERGQSGIVQQILRGLRGDFIAGG